MLKNSAIFKNYLPSQHPLNHRVFKNVYRKYEINFTSTAVKYFSLKSQFIISRRSQKVNKARKSGKKNPKIPIIIETFFPFFSLSFIPRSIIIFAQKVKVLFFPVCELHDLKKKEKNISQAPALISIKLGCRKPRARLIHARRATRLINKLLAFVTPRK